MNTIVFALASILAAANAAEPDAIRVTSRLVLVPASVVDSAGRPVTGLSREHFRVFEDKVERPVVQVSSEPSPVSVVVVFDLSGSMSADLHRSRAALQRLVSDWDPGDETALIRIGGGVKVISDFTDQPVGLAGRLLFDGASGYTSLLDGIHRATSLLRQSHNRRKAVVVISDGGDNYSRYTVGEIRRHLRECDARVYTLGIYPPGGDMFDGLSEAGDGRRLMEALADWSGGRSFAATGDAEIKRAVDRIQQELRQEYVIAYTPSSDAEDGRYHRVSVKLAGSDTSHLTVYARPGYRAGAE